MSNENDFYQYGGVRPEIHSKNKWTDGVGVYGLMDEKPHCGVVLDSSNPEKVTLDVSERHAIIIGSTGSGKTRRITELQLLSLIGTDDSVIVTDPKGELYKKLAGTLQENGKNVLVMDFRHPAKSVRWNPLAYTYELMKKGDPESIDLAYANTTSMGATICPVTSEKEPYWEYAGSKLISGVLQITVKYASCIEEATMESAVCLFT